MIRFTEFSIGPMPMAMCHDCASPILDDPESANRQLHADWHAHIERASRVERAVQAYIESIDKEMTPMQAFQMFASVMLGDHDG